MRRLGGCDRPGWPCVCILGSGSGIGTRPARGPGLVLYATLSRKVLASGRAVPACSPLLEGLTVGKGLAVDGDAMSPARSAWFWTPTNEEPQLICH